MKKIIIVFSILLLNIVYVPIKNFIVLFNQSKNLLKEVSLSEEGVYINVDYIIDDKLTFTK